MTQLPRRLPVPLVFVLVYLIGALVEVVLPIPLAWRLPIRPDVVGAVLFLAGASIAAWGWFTFYHVGTTRVPGQTSSVLVTWGPYRFTRNPMYVGLSVAYVGEAGLQHQVWPLLLLPLVWIYLARVVIPLEESKLRSAFGERYEAYAGRVRRWI